MTTDTQRTSDHRPGRARDRGATLSTRHAAHRRDTLWLAALVHRISGLLLVLFLPLHFLTLGLALEGAGELDGFLALTDMAVFKFGEAGLVFLLSIHAIGGVRLLVIENLGWHANQKHLATGIFAAAVVIAALFLLRML